MTDHHPDAADVLVQADEDALYEGRRVDLDEVLDIFAAAGLAVVKVGEPPPWMVDAEVYANGNCCMDLLVGEWAVRYDYSPGSTPLYVIKEQDREG